MAELLIEKLTQKDPEKGKKIHDEIIRFCKYNGFIPFGPAVEIPTDILQRLADLPEKEWDKCVEKYQKETFTTKPLVNTETSHEIREIILGVIGIKNNV